jgi:hypothetical protein
VQAAWVIQGSSHHVSTGGGFREQTHAGVDYIVRVPIKVKRGRMRLSIEDEGNYRLATAVVETVEGTTPEEQPDNLVQLPFVANNSPARLVLSNEAFANPFAQVGPIEVYELGPSRFHWTRYPRFVIHAIQKTFLTAVMLPLAIIGLFVLIFRKHRSVLVILSIVPIYFVTVQSAVHTEYRYVIAVTYFLFAFAGVAIGFGIDLLFKKLITLRSSSSAMKSVPSA